MSYSGIGSLGTVDARQLFIEMNRSAGVVGGRREFLARPYVLQGEFLVQGVGEAIKDISFPVSFIERPHVYFGSNLAENQESIEGYYPIVQGTVLSYVTREEGIEKRFFDGAKIVAISSGVDTQQIWLNYMFIGMALVNPAGGQGTVDGVV